MKLPYKKELIEKTIISLNYDKSVKSYLSYEQYIAILNSYHEKFKAFQKVDDAYMELYADFDTNVVKKYLVDMPVNIEAKNVYGDIPYDDLVNINHYKDRDVFFDFTSKFVNVSINYTPEREDIEKPLTVIPYLQAMIDFFSTEKTRAELKSELSDFFNLDFKARGENALKIDGEPAFEYALYTIYHLTGIEPEANVKYLSKFIKKHFSKEEHKRMFSALEKMPETDNSIIDFVTSKGV